MRRRAWFIVGVCVALVLVALVALVASGRRRCPEPLTVTIRSSGGARVHVESTVRCGETR